MKSKEKGRLKAQLKDALRLCLDEHVKAITAAKEVEREAESPRITSGDWEHLGQRIAQSCQFLRADSQQEKEWANEHWRLAGGSNEMCQSLLRKAGAMLLKSPNVRKTLPPLIAQEADPLIRWFAYLKYRGQHRVDNYYEYVDDAGEKHFGGTLGSIPQLAYSSSVICEECSASEL